MCDCNYNAYINFLFRFLATGETFTSLASQYRVGVTTVSRIVLEVCTAIWTTMQEEYMAMPRSAKEWKAIANNFEEQWNYPHCIGAVDGKHVTIQSPANSGTLFFNYKGTFSIVLMAMVDALYRFISVDIGSYGKQSDAGIFAHSNLGKALQPPNALNLPNACVIEGGEDIGPMPYVAVGDEAFPLQLHIMRPYPGRNLTNDQNAYNYRNSRARRIVECTFGILSGRWRVYHTKMGVIPSTVEAIVQATTVLHNMLQNDTTNALAVDDQSVGQGLQRLRGLPTRATEHAVQIRQNFTNYFVAHPVSWQESYIQRGLID